MEPEPRVSTGGRLAHVELETLDENGATCCGVLKEAMANEESEPTNDI